MTNFLQKCIGPALYGGIAFWASYTYVYLNLESQLSYGAWAVAAITLFVVYAAVQPVADFVYSTAQKLTNLGLDTAKNAAQTAQASIEKGQKKFPG